MRWKDLESLRAAISHHESNLGRGQLEDITTSDDDLSDHGAGEAAEAEMAIAPVANDTPSGSAMTQSSDPLQPKAKPMPWRWVMRMVAHHQLAPSPLWMMIY